MLGQIHHLRGNLHFALSQAGPCRAAHEQALDAARRLGDPKLEAKAWSGLGDADYALGRWRAAAEYFRRCVVLAESNDWIRIAEPNRLMLGHCLAYSAEFHESVRLMRQALEAMRPLNDSYSDMFALESLGLVLALSGQYEAARGPLEQSLELAERVGAKRYEAGLLAQIADCEADAGNRDRARALCLRARAITAATGYGFVGPAVCAYAALMSDDPVERDTLLAEGEARLGESLAHNIAWYYRAAIELRMLEQNWAEAEALCQRFLKHRPEGDPPRFYRLLVARARAIIAEAREPGPASTAALTEVAAELAACGIRLPMSVGAGRS
jgi:tetratricopeptide (TPR) repeat protein